MPVLIDGRELAPPEPLERTLAALDSLPAGDELILLVYCSPAPLFDILGMTGWTWREEALDDGTHRILIRRRDG